MLPHDLSRSRVKVDMLACSWLAWHVLTLSTSDSEEVSILIRVFLEQDFV